jgi:hypothetical protein
MMHRPVLLLTMIVGIAVVLSGCGMIASMQEASQVQAKLSDAGFKNVSVSRSVRMTNGVTMHGITTFVDRPPNPPFDQKLATQVAEIVISSSPRVQDLDFVTVQLQSPGNSATIDLPPNVWMDLVRDFSEPPRVQSAVLAKNVRNDDIRGFQPVDPTTDFPTEQGIFHALITVNNLPPETPVKAVWTAVDTHGAAPPNQKIYESNGNATGSARIHLAVGTDGMQWPKGSYRVDVIWDDKVQATLPFTVAGG